jgi:hypothetical protein
MNTYAENFAIASQFVTRNRTNILEIRDENFWMNDVAHKMEVSTVAQEGWLKIENPSEKAIGFFPVDGTEGVFQKSGLDVLDTSKFEYLPSPTAEEKKTAGPCDCLLLDERWRFFEFKNGPLAGTGETAAKVNREKAEKQLARTMTYFREKAVEKGIGKTEAVFEGVIVTKPDFYPATPAALFDRGSVFFLDFDARLIEITTDETYIIQAIIPPAPPTPTTASPSFPATLAAHRVP